VKQQRWFTPYLLVGPGVLWVLVFAIWPFLNTVILSFTDARPLSAVSFTGVSNYVRLGSDPQFGYALTTSLLYVVVCVPVLTLLPLLLALLVNARVPGVGFFRTGYYFPVVASAVVAAIAWQFLFSGDGIVNQAIQFFGFSDKPIAFLSDRWLLLLCSIGLTVWKGLGYYMVVYLAALGNVGRDLHEAAAMDGAGSARRFWSVTVPGVRGPMALVAVLICTGAIRVFTELYVLTGGSGGPGGQDISIVMLIKQMGSGLTGQIGYSSAISVVLFLLTLVPLAVVGVVNNGEQLREMRDNRAARRALRARATLATTEAAR